MCVYLLLMFSERKNVNLPGVVVDLPTLTDKDIDDIKQWAIPLDIDFIAASFVRKGSDLDAIRNVSEGACSKAWTACNAKLSSAAYCLGVLCSACLHMFRACSDVLIMPE